MTMTDPIADMLTRIRNGNVAMHDEVKMPSSKLKEALAAILKREGYIEGFSVADDTERPGKVLTISMKYAQDRTRTISGIKRVSKPGLRVYAKADSPAPSARWPRCRRGVHQPGPDDRSRGSQVPHGRRSPLFRLVVRSLP